MVPSEGCHSSTFESIHMLHLLPMHSQKMSTQIVSQGKRHRTVRTTKSSFNIGCGNDLSQLFIQTGYEFSYLFSLFVIDNIFQSTSRNVDAKEGTI
ncbi:hypothetical protein BDB01DRAFT_786029 [Pilobolus umbonatus]|nr:hypothetical protein BDB01DRAFT_786029 [Pilobolus umbonatus]